MRTWENLNHFRVGTTLFHVFSQCRFVDGNKLATLSFADQVRCGSLWATLILVLPHSLLALACKLATVCFSAGLLNTDGSPLTLPRALCGLFGIIVYLNRLCEHRLFHCEEQSVLKFVVLPELLLLEPHIYRKVAVILRATLDPERIPFGFQLLKFRCPLPHQGYDILRSEVGVGEIAETFGRKKHLQQGTVGSLAFVGHSAVLRAIVTDHPLHTTRVLHFRDVPQTERRL
jgi:hypothetical protein